MKVKVDQILIDYKGETFKDPKDNTEVQLKKLMVEALLANFNDEQNLSGEEKLKRWQLAVRIQATESEIDLTVEEVALVKKLIGKGFGIDAVGAAWTVLDNSN